MRGRVQSTPGLVCDLGWHRNRYGVVAPQTCSNVRLPLPPICLLVKTPDAVYTTNMPSFHFASTVSTVIRWYGLWLPQYPTKCAVQWHAEPDPAAREERHANLNVCPKSQPMQLRTVPIMIQTFAVRVVRSSKYTAISPYFPACTSPTSYIQCISRKLMPLYRSEEKQYGSASKCSSLMGWHSPGDIKPRIASRGKQGSRVQLNTESRCNNFMAPRHHGRRCGGASVTTSMIGALGVAHVDISG